MPIPPLRPKIKTELICIRVSPLLKKKMQREAYKDHRRLSPFIEKLMIDYLKTKDEASK